MSGGAALTLGGGGRKGGGGMLGGSGPGGKKVGILAALASASDCSEITWWSGTDAVMRTMHGDKLITNKTFSVCRLTWMLLPSRLCRRRPSTLLIVAVCPPITSIVPLDFLKADGTF